MDIVKNTRYSSVALAALLSTALLAGCDQTEQPEPGEQNANITENQADMDLQGQERPLGHVEEFDDYSLLGSLTPTDRLPASMLQEHNIEAGAERLLFNASVYEKLPDGQLEPVAADVKVVYENLVGHEVEVDLRRTVANGDVSYIGTLDSSGQLVFRFAMEALPEGSNEPLQTEFEVQLPQRDD